MPPERQEIDLTLLHEAAQILRHGGLVAYPTDTVYGLAADPTNPEAVHKLSEAKRRDPNQPMPHLVANLDMVEAVTLEVPASAAKLAGEFWPGGLTIILDKAQTYASKATGATIGLRIPDHAVPREVSRLFGGPITGTSANVAGGPEPLSADDVRRALGDSVDLVIDGGSSSGERPSTVIDCTQDLPTILREGAIPREEIERVLGRKLQA